MTGEYDLTVVIESPAQVTYVTPGPQGAPGEDGIGLPPGGTTSQALVKINSTNYNAEWTTINKSFVGLNNVDNTSDINKPVSLAVQNAIDSIDTSLTKESFVLSSSDISAKYITLSNAPKKPESVSLFPSGGLQQVNGVDFDVVGSVVSWAGLGLDGFLEENDRIIIHY